MCLRGKPPYLEVKTPYLEVKTSYIEAIIAFLTINKNGNIALLIGIEGYYLGNGDVCDVFPIHL